MLSARMLQTLKRKGFSLIELMVVVSIIAVLAAVGLVLYQQSQRAGRDGKRIADMQEVQKALEQYYATTNGYPAAANYAGLSTPIASYFVIGATPSDPINSTPNIYSYVRNSNCNGLDKYVVCAQLEIPTGKANSNGVPAVADVCNALNATGATHYCMKSLAN